MILIFFFISYHYRAQWEKVKGAHVYVIEISDDITVISPSGTVGTAPPVSSTARLFISWKQVDIVTKTHCVLTGLTSGIKYAIRVHAVGAKGKGFYSAPVIVKIL